MIYICKLETVYCFLIFRWNPGEGCKVRKFTLRRWYRGSLKDANLSGWKTVCGRWRSGEYLPENIHISFLSDIWHGKASQTDVSISKNSFQQIEKSFGAECMGVFCYLQRKIRMFDAKIIFLSPFVRSSIVVCIALSMSWCSLLFGWRRGNLYSLSVCGIKNFGHLSFFFPDNSLFFTMYSHCMIAIKIGIRHAKFCAMFFRQMNPKGFYSLFLLSFL